MKIKTLRLENFQGIAHAEFNFDGVSASIYGDNATGKTTVFNAVTWLLFDKASTGAKNFNPKTKGPNGAELHNLDHSAEASFLMPSGEIATFRKVFHEVWKKKRGAAAEEFDGHTVDFFIDGVPVKEKEYTSTLENYCGGIERMKILTMPDYFAETLPWDQRRKILIELCGDVTDADVIRSNEDLMEIDEFLRKPGTGNQFYSVDEYKKIAASRKTEINRQLQSLPGRIDEARRAMPEPGVSLAEIGAKIAKQTAFQKELQERRAGMFAGTSALAEAKRQVAEAEAELAAARSAYLAKTGDANDQVMEEISKLTTVLANSKALTAEMRAHAKDLRAKAEKMTDQRQALLRDYAETQALVWDETQEMCPACGQRLPADRIDELKGAFNQHRSERLTSINERGKTECSGPMIEDAIKQAEEAEQIAADKESTANLTQLRLDALRSTLKQSPAFETTQEYLTLSGNISIARAAEREAMQSSTPDTSGIDRQMQDLSAEISGLQRQMLQIEQAETQKKRIEELDAEEKRLGAEYETLDRGIWLCDEFTKAKVKMLTSRIDSKFRNVSFRLFQEQLNGGLKDDCEVLIPGEGGRMVPYSFANNAARINAGLEIIGVLADHWNMEMPVFIDNAESVTHLARSWTQTIRLVVSEQDKQLRLALD